MGHYELECRFWRAVRWVVAVSLISGMFATVFEAAVKG